MRNTVEEGTEIHELAGPKTGLRSRFIKTIGARKCMSNMFSVDLTLYFKIL